MSGELKEGSFVRLRSGTEGWIKGQIVEYTDILPVVGGVIYTGPGYKVHILEGKHKGETIRVPANYVEPIVTKPGREPLYPHVPKKKEPLFPHVPGGRPVVLPQTEPEITQEEWQKAEDMWEVTKGDAERDEVAGVYLWSLLTKYYPDDKDKQIRLMGFMNQMLEKYPDGRVPQEEARALAKKWDVEKVLVKEMMEFLPQTINLLASTEGDPIRKFCCRQCGECAPPELLEEGRFPDRIAWLRGHYKDKHPGMWGRMSPMTAEDFEPVSPEYRHLASLVNEPLPREAE